MQLVKAGRIVEDRFVRVLDDAPVPEGVLVMLPAARLLADARDLVLRQAPVGVIWPNDRRIAELVPYLDWIALVALVFPTFKDGRAYSQARLLRERHGFRGELRATGQVLRDQLCFCSAPASTPSRSARRPMRRISPRRSSATACSISRPEMAARAR
jgi:uncharacterized protein (DUF934 family)